MKKLSPIAIGTGIGLALGGAMALLGGTALFQRFEGPIYDLLMRTFADPEKGRTSRVKVVLFTDADLEAFVGTDNEYLSAWPPPRSIIGELIASLQEKRPAAIVVDLVFPLPDQRHADEDEGLTRAALDAGNVVIAMSAVPGAELDPRHPELPPSAAVEVYGDTAALPPAGALNPPFERLRQPGIGLGNAFIAPDPGGIVRRIGVANRVGDRFVASLPVAAAMRALSESSLTVAAGGRALARFGNLNVPLDGSGNLLVNFRGDRSAFQCIGVERLVAFLSGGDAAPEWWDDLEAGDIVVIGANVTGNPDKVDSPIDHSLDGSVLVATAIDNLLRGDALYRPPAWVLALIAILLATAVGAVTVLGSRRRSAIALALPVVLLFLGLAALLFRAGIVLDVTTPLIGALNSYLGVALFLFNTEGKKRREIRRSFSQYVSNEVVEELEQNPDALQLGGQRHVLTVFFSDIAGFTGISEKMQPEELVAFMNEYLTLMTDTIQETGGVIDKYIGDAVMAFWGAPIPRADHAARALLAAARCRERLADFTAAKAKENLPPLFSRVGIHTGPMIVGNVGSRTRFNYTVLGDAVNLASRLEGSNKFFGSGTMVSEDALAAAGPGAGLTRPLAKIRVKGRNEPVMVHELLGAGGSGMTEKEPWVETYEEGFAAFQRGDFAAASRAFRAADQARAGGDPPSQKYLHVIEEFGNAPPKVFDGVLTLTEK